MGGPSRDAPAGPSLQELAKLEKQKDRAGIAAAYLAWNDRGMADQALRVLNSLPSSPAMDNDRAVALLVRADPGQQDLEQALRLLDKVLEQEPRHSQGLWNRALTLHELGLNLLATRAFEDAARLGEEGWSQEAAERAAALRRAALDGRQRWRATLAPGARADSSQVDAKLQLATLHLEQGRLVEAREHAFAGWTLAQKDNDWGRGAQLLARLGRAARLQGDLPLARAFLGEALDRAGDGVDQELERSLKEELGSLE